MKYKLSSKDALRLTIIMIAFLAVFVSFTDNSSAATINVGSGAGNQSATIQGGINTAQINDTVIVHSKGSNYVENIAVYGNIANKHGLTIKAATGENVTVAPAIPASTIFSISGNGGVIENVTIQGFTLTGASGTNGKAIDILRGNFCNILNNNFYNNTYAISMAYTNNITIQNNIINNPTTPAPHNKIGVFALQLPSGNSGLKILNNNISNVGVGVNIAGANSQIIGNIISTSAGNAGNLAYGIYLLPAYGDFQNITISQNKITGGGTGANSVAGIGLTTNGPNALVSPNTQIYSNDITNYRRGIAIGINLPYQLVNGVGVTDIYLNRFFGNIVGLSLNLTTGTNSSGLINATNNWWGKNIPTLSTSATEPTTTGTAVSIWQLSGLGTLTYNPWLILNVSPNPSTILVGHTSTITGDLTKNSDNIDTATIYPGKYLPNGITTNFGSDSFGSVNPVSATTVNGKSTTTFTANFTPGISHPSATVDAQTVNTNVVIDPVVDLVVTKDVETFEPVWNYNDTQAFWITISNYGPNDATLVKVADLLPAGLVFDHAIVSTGIFDEATMTWYLGDLVNGGFETLELFVNVTGHNTIVTNTVNATAYEAEFNPADNVASIDVTIPAAAHVNLTKEYNNLQGNVITSSNYQQNFWGLIKANNIGPDSTDVILEDVLNSFPFIQFATDQFGENFYASFNNGTTWVPGSLSGINFQDLTAFGNFFISNMQSGDNIWLKVFLTTDFATGVVSNEATATTSAYEYLTPGFASADLTVPPAADLFVTKWDDADYIGQPAKYLDFVHYYIQIDNLGPDDATGVLLKDLIPAGLVIDPFSVLASQGTFDPVTGIWTVTDGLSPTLGYGSSAFLSFLAQVVGTGAINNTVDVNATTYDPDTTNNHATDTINVPLAADIDVSKNFYYEDLGPIIFPDNPMDRYWKFFSEIIVTNNGPDTATNVKITDLLGPGMELAPFDVFGSWFVTYTGQNPDLDPPENNPSFDPLTMIWTIPAMNNGDTWILDFFTIANTTGTVNNTATFDPTTADQYDWNSTNNVGFVSTYVPTAQTQLTKWFQNDSTYGSPHTTTAYYNDNLYAFIKLYNAGPDTAKYITVIDDFTNDLLYNSALMETSYDGGVTWAIDPNAYWLDFGTYFELEWFPNDLTSNGMALFRIPGQVNVSNTTIVNNATETQRTFNPDGNNTDNPPINQPGFNTINTTTTLNIPQTPTAIAVNTVSGFKGDIVDLTATLTDKLHNIPVSGKSVQFSVDGNIVGTAVTNAQGIATLAYTITQNSGTYTILAQFLQDTTYAASSNTNTLNVLGNTPPVVTSTDPANSAVNVPLNKVVKINFNKAIKLVQPTWIEFLNGTNKVLFTPTVSGSTLSLTPNTILKSGLIYTVIVHSNSVTTLDGAGLAAPYSFKFTTETGPTVTTTDPAINAVNVALNKVVKINFNKSIKLVQPTWIEFLNGTNKVQFTPTVSGSTLSLTPNTILKSGLIYTVIVHSNSVTALGGAGLAAPYSFKFTTETGPTVKSTDPVYNAVNVPVNKVVKINFNKSIKIVQPTWIEFKTASGTVKSFTATASGTTLSLKPYTNLASKTVYNVIIHSNSVTTYGGAGLASPYSTRFTTA